eukprot:CAMPEP_0172456982 /NCGR_PEP_ID=MMETSP1065-20121228/19040_1 /TAXON_ID=265537 /ORGANISM="Amphiprora paludosa, Strain CCMP125" /LENGTH=69 /DNA_ID=CAMNT_0013210375 /DNA_START=86 /DNA_END=292 /DNA_ORIENTATION=+
MYSACFLISLVPFVAGFSTPVPSAPTTTALQASRRDFMEGLAWSVAGSAALVVGANPAQAAGNEVDFSK